MSKNTYNNSSVLRAITAMLLSFGLVFCLGITPNVSAQTQSKRAKSTATQPETSPGRGQQEGIKVHGHWTIEVRNPDGTLVTHREFENALTPVGGLCLAAFLSRSNTPGLWRIHLGGANTNTIIDPFGGVGANIYEPAEPTAADAVVFKNLSVQVQGFNGNHAAGLQLSGSVTAQMDGSIALVDTGVQLQPFGPLTYQPFSAATLATPVSVAAGQFVLVTVTISFS